MLEEQVMAPSKDRRSVPGHGQGESSDAVISRSSHQRDVSSSVSDRLGTNRRSDDGGDGDEKGSDSDDGDGGSRGNSNGGDRNKGSQHSKDDGEHHDDDRGNGGGRNNNNGNGNNNDNNRDNGGSSKSESSATSIVVSTMIPTLPSVTVPPTSATTTSALSTSSVPLISVVESTSVVTTTQMATMTTIIPIMTTFDLTDQPRKGLDPNFTPPFPIIEPSTSLQTIAPTATDTTATAGATAIAQTEGDDSDSDNDNDNDGRHSGGRKDRGDNRPQPGLDPTAEHALIAVGSIGGFVLFCFITWIIYRTVKKSRQGQNFNGRKAGFLTKLPWRKNQGDAAWDNRSVFMASDLPPLYQQGSQNSMSNAGFYGGDKVYLQQQPQPGPLSRSNTGGSQRSLLPPGVTPGSVIMIPAEQYMAMSQTQSPISSDPNSTFRSRMPDQFFNQSELARQPSDAYDPTRRQVHRASELSSLSSGFGDGDIIVPETFVNPPQPAATQLRQSNNYTARFSWMGRRDAGDRETVYTATSEDRPARYRSVGSWVNQQSGRLKRADERQQSEMNAPPVPDLPSDTSGQQR
ncbi:hypothetical protein JX265_009771 [Neoarthrinium moseri]|uniref:Uncharacterized protein n=1 Tax=Neoarthrinium moseri TaxID=1658444 RepID=A0A9Q0AJ35_9PEZI|nr:hypothetical protein JX265_009771 [Neoarthrinium moseri]